VTAPTVSDGVLVVDNSILVAMATCPTAAALRYALGLTLQEDSAPLRAGHAVHETLATYLRDRDPDAAMAVLVKEYREWATQAVEPVDRLSAGNVEAIMKVWMATHPVSGLPFRIEPGLIEVGFAVPLAENILFVGRMDGLVQDASGAWYVLEHKTTGRLDERWRKRYRTSAQITGYCWAAQQHLQQPVAGCFLNGIELGRMPSDPVRKCRTHGVPYAECGPLHCTADLVIEHRAPHQTAAWHESAVRLARRYAHLVAQVGSLNDISPVPMVGQFTGACVDCQFSGYCAVGRPQSVAEAIMRYDPWSPFDHAFANVLPT
jgi:hypothetical protein